MRRTVYIVLVLLLVASVGLTAHAYDQPLRITHDLGTIQLSSPPKNVIVFDYGVLDTLDTIGVEIAGVPTQSLPPYLQKYQQSRYKNVGSLVEPDFETIYGMKPDLIIISGRQSAHYDELSKIAPTLFMGLNTADYLHSFESNMRTLGKIFNKESVIESKLAEINESIDRVQKLTKDKTALTLIVTAGKASAFGPGSRYGFVYDVLGLTPADSNIVSSTHGQNISFEFILVRDPDYLLVIDRDAVVGGEGAQAAKQVIENELVKHTKAYRNGNIVYLDPGYWYLSGGGLTSFSMMIQDIEKAVR